MTPLTFLGKAWFSPSDQQRLNDFPPALMRMKAKSVRKTIAAIESPTDTPKLIRIK